MVKKNISEALIWKFTSELFIGYCKLRCLPWVLCFSSTSSTWNLVVLPTTPVLWAWTGKRQNGRRGEEGKRWVLVFLSIRQGWYFSEPGVEYPDVFYCSSILNFGRKSYTLWFTSKSCSMALSLDILVHFFFRWNYLSQIYSSVPRF